MKPNPRDWVYLVGCCPSCGYELLLTYEWPEDTAREANAKPVRKLKLALSISTKCPICGTDVPLKEFLDVDRAIDYIAESQKKGGDTPPLFLVDYDIPVNARKGFYRSLTRELMWHLFRKMGGARTLKEIRAQLSRSGVYFRSTQSVILTDREDVAWIVYEVASRYGTAHLFEAKLLAGFISFPSRLEKQEEGGETAKCLA